MSDETTEPGTGDEGPGQPPREHPQDPAEGPDDDRPDQPREQPQDPAEGPDDESATS